MNDLSQAPAHTSDLLTFLEDSASECLRRAAAAPLPLSRLLTAEAEELLCLKTNLSQSISRRSENQIDLPLSQAA